MSETDAAINRINPWVVGYGVPEPPDYSAFAEYAKKRKWTLHEEWLYEHIDEGNGTVYPAHWSWVIYREEKFGEVFHAFHLSQDERSMQDERIWEHTIDFADFCWQNYLREHGLVKTEGN